jgi:hypothetical protein
MDPGAAAECDQKLREIITLHCPSGMVVQQVASRVIWGKPAAAGAKIV